MEFDGCKAIDVPEGHLRISFNKTLEKDSRPVLTFWQANRYCKPGVYVNDEYDKYDGIQPLFALVIESRQRADAITKILQQIITHFDKQEEKEKYNSEHEHF